MTGVRSVIGAILIGLAVPGEATPAAAQTILTAPKDIARCLCLERSVDERKAEMEAEQHSFESDKLRLEIMKEHIEQQRLRVNTGDAASVEAFKSLLDRYDSEEARIRGEVLARFADSVERHNAAVGSFDATCRGTYYDAEIAAALRPNLNCPRP